MAGLPSPVAAGILGSGQRRGRVGKPMGSSTGGISPPGGAVTAAPSGQLAAPLYSSGAGRREEGLWSWSSSIHTWSWQPAA